MNSIVVTGGSGKAGRATIRDLSERGYRVLNVDRARPETDAGHFLEADLTDLGATVEALHGADAVVHLAAIPAPDLQPEGTTFDVNTLSTYNVFRAATLLGLPRVVWASSETTLGLPFDRQRPHYAPIDEEHPLYPESSYALSKVLGEEMARQFARWHPGTSFVGLRFSNIMEPHDYRHFPSYWGDATLRKWNLWGYIDADDVAQSCRLGLEADLIGAEAYIIAAADTVMDRPSRELMAEVFPGVPVKDDLSEHETLLGIDKARRELGFAPAFSWRDRLANG